MKEQVPRLFISNFTPAMNAHTCTLLFELLYRSLSPNRKAAVGDELPALGSPDSQTWVDIIALAERNEVSGLAYDAVLTLPPHQRPDNETLMRWTAQIQSTERDNLLMRRELGRALDHLTSLGLECVMLKGLTLSQFYPNPLHRPVGDIDLYVPLDLQHRFVQGLKQLGAEVNEEFDPKHVSLQCCGMYWELHFRSMFFYSRYTDRQYLLLEREETSADCLYHENIEDRSVLVFPPRLRMVYMTAHFLHHLLVEEVNIRQVVDWMLVLHHDRTALAIGEVLFIRTLRQLGLYRLYRALGHIATHHLGFVAEGYVGLTDLNQTDAHRAQIIIDTLTQGHVPGCKPHRPQLPTDNFWQRAEHYLQLCRRCIALFKLCPRETLATPIGFLRWARKRRMHEKMAQKG